MQISKNSTHHTLANMPNISYIGKIPVRNLWLLLLYASDFFRHKSKARQGVEDSPDNVADLVAEILTHHVKKRIRRNLSLGYIPYRDDLRRVRGRVDLLRTQRHHLLKRGMVACRYEELSIDTPRNRYIAAALLQLTKLVSSQSGLGRQCHLLAATFDGMGVSRKKPAWSEVAADRIGHHDADDRDMLDAARLVFELVLPAEMAGNRHHVSPDRSNHQWIRSLFEKGIAGFYKVVLTRHGWQTRPQSEISWPIRTKSSDEVNRIFPKMYIDIILEHQDQQRRTIVDTKFTHILQKGQWGNETFKSKHLYQIYAYIRSQECDDDPLSKTASGLLLYPSIGVNFDEFVVIQGHKIRFATVDLTAKIPVIRDQLFRAVEVPCPA